jgi:hypothetical protein
MNLERNWLCRHRLYLSVTQPILRLTQPTTSAWHQDLPLCFMMGSCDEAESYVLLVQLHAAH